MSADSPDLNSFAISALGPFIIGMAISSIIYGVSALQAYIYYTENSSRDIAPLKFLVAFVFILDSGQVALTVQVAYSYAVQHFGDVAYLHKNLWSTYASNVSGIMIAVLLDFSFAYRIYLVSGHKMVVPVVICALSLACFVCTIVYTSLVTLAGSSSTQFTPWIATAAGSCLISQLLISGSLIWFLYRQKTSFPKTNRAMNHLITYIVRTSVLTTTLIIAMLISYLSSKNSSLYDAIYWLAVRVYLCSFLSMLNGRESLRRELEGENNLSRGQEFISLSNLGSSGDRSGEESRDLPTYQRKGATAERA